MINLLPLVRQTAADHPGLLRTNTGETCHAFITLVLARMKALGHVGWGHVGKIGPEGQYRPPTGFPRQVGPYLITGVSHDAIGCATQRVDLLGGANDGSVPISTPAEAVWIDIPPEHWRPNNPIIPFDGAPQPPVVIVPPPVKPYPGDPFFIEKLGQVLEADYTEAGQRLNAGSAVWFSRTIWRYVHEGMTIEQSTAQSRKEWRVALGLPPLP